VPSSRIIWQPGGVLNQILVAVVREHALAIDAVMPELIDVRIGLIRRALAIAVDIEALEEGEMITASFCAMVWA